MKFDTLYKQNSNGSIQQWTISTKRNEVTTIYGQKDGKLQTATDLVREGKNLGRSNATTPESQAELQAQQQYEGKLKEGYTTDLELANSTKNVLGAVKPMLAHKIEEREQYVVWPSLANPKLDGFRNIAIIQNGKVHMFSRTQKERFTMPHIVKELETLYKGQTLILDGELYCSKLSNDFNKIASICKRDDLHPDHKLIQYHVYDVVSLEGYLTRTKALDPIREKGHYCVTVEVVTVNSRQELDEYQAKCLEHGYEGAILRNPTGSYEHKRSNNLLKVKTFQDAEYEVVSLEEGKGKLMGHVGAFICKLPTKGETFRASPIGSLELMEDYWLRRAELVGRQVTVKYQALTPGGVPRFPKVKCIRDSMD